MSDGPGKHAAGASARPSGKARRRWIATYAGVLTLIVAPAGVATAITWRDGVRAQHEQRALHEQSSRAQDDLAVLRERELQLARELEALRENLADAEAERAAAEAKRRLFTQWKRDVADALPRLRTIAAAKRDAAASEASASAPARSRPPPPAGPSGNMFFAELMDDPSYALLVGEVHRQMMRSRYTLYLRSLGSDPRAAQLEDLLVEQQLAALDVKEAELQQGLGTPARPAGLSQFEIVRKFRAETKELLGEEEFARFQRFETSLPIRESVHKVALRLSYSQEPLTAEKEEQLVDAILAVSNIREPPGARSPTGAFSDRDLAAAQAVLSSTQMQDLRELNAELRGRVRTASPGSASPQNR